MQYEKIRYPDGQISIKIKHFGAINIEERINSYEDLITVLSLASLIPKNDRKLLSIPCMFGQRSDRKFDPLQSFDLKIICDIINSMEFEQVQIFDPHSDVCMALINNSVKQTSFAFVARAAVNISQKSTHKYDTMMGGELVLISPDAGAYKKVFEYGNHLKLPVVAANKFRDKEGNITLHFLGDVKGKECLIVDDICDGGYTFYLLAKALREQGATKVYLYVSHMYASKGFTTKLEPTDPQSQLRYFLDGIYCTNSVKDLSNDYFDGMNTKNLHGLITQYKII